MDDADINSKLDLHMTDILRTIEKGSLDNIFYNYIVNNDYYFYPFFDDTLDKNINIINI